MEVFSIFLHRHLRVAHVHVDQPLDDLRLHVELMKKFMEFIRYLSAADAAAVVEPRALLRQQPFVFGCTEAEQR